MPRATLGQPDRRQPTTTEQSVFGECLDGVLAAGGAEPAAGQTHRRHHVAVQLDEKDQPAGQPVTHGRDPDFA